MDYKSVQRLYKDNWVILNDILDIDSTFLAVFVQERVFPRNAEEKILKKLDKSSADARHEFLHVISTRGDSGRKVFWEALVQTHQYELADILYPERAPSSMVNQMESGASGEHRGNHMSPPDSPTTSSAQSQSEQNKNLHGNAVDHGNVGNSRAPSTVVTIPGNQLIPPDDGSSIGCDPQPDHNPDIATEPSKLTLETRYQKHPAQPEVNLDQVIREHDNFDDDDDLSSTAEPIINQELILTTDEDVKKLFTHPNVYEMSAGHRGRALILNNVEFEEKVNSDQEDLDNRAGSDVDCTNIKTVLEKLGFIVTVKTDQDTRQMRNEIQKETEREDQANYGMFILVILSHGDRDVVYGSDGRKMSSDNIVDLLKPQKFVGMQGKPKWIIQQTCSGVKADKVQPDSKPPGILTRSTNKTASTHSSVSDLYMLKSSFPGYMSLRDPKYGSFMIRNLVEVLYKYAAHQDLQSLTTEVRKRVMKRSIAGDHEYGVQTVFDSGTLLKKIYLFPGYKSQLPS